MARDSNNVNSEGFQTVWERFLWGSRYLVMIAVVSGLLSSLLLFILGAWDVGKAISSFPALLNGSEHELAQVTILSAVIGAVDTFLIAVVVLLFSFGLYELFISHIDPAKGSVTEGILKINNLEALKDKIASVIIMALIVKFFQIILFLKVQSIVESLLYAGSVVLLALSVLVLQIGQKLLTKLKVTPIATNTSVIRLNAEDEKK